MQRELSTNRVGKATSQAGEAGGPWDYTWGKSLHTNLEIGCLTYTTEKGTRRIPVLRKGATKTGSTKVTRIHPIAHGQGEVAKPSKKKPHSSWL